MIKLRLFKTNQFKRSYKKLRFTDDEELSYIEVVYHLLCMLPLENKYRDHQLKGSMKAFRECHLKPDLLLVYMVEDNVLKLVDVGTHAELFD